MPVLALCWARWSEASIWVSWLRDRVSSSRSVRLAAKAVVMPKSKTMIDNNEYSAFMIKSLEQGSKAE